MLIAAHHIHIGQKHIKPGGLVPEGGGRNFGPEIMGGKILSVPDAALATILGTALSMKDDRRQSFAGSRIQPEVVNLDGEDVHIGKIVVAALDRSGLSVIGWNKLPDAARETLILAEATVLRGEDEIPALPAGEGAENDPGPEPDAPHILFDPQVHGLEYRGSVVGHTVVDAKGEAVARVDKDTYAELKKAEKAGHRAWAVIAEGDGD